MLDGTAVKEIAELAKAGQAIENLQTKIGDHTFVTTQLHHLPPKPESEPKPLAFASLQALADYVAADRDGVDLAKCVFHVESPTTAHLLGPLTGEKRQRFTYATATCKNLAAGFVGKLWPQEEFIVAMQSRFQDLEARGEVLEVVRKLKQEQSIELDDDGVTQRVTAKGGVTLVNQIKVPNPVKLVPFRTFRDVEQPASSFVLRVVNGPQIGLFESDGGAWELEAAKRVAAWLTENVPTIPTLR